MNITMDQRVELLRSKSSPQLHCDLNTTKREHHDAWKKLADRKCFVPLNTDNIKEV